MDSFDEIMRSLTGRIGFDAPVCPECLAGIEIARSGGAERGLRWSGTFLLDGRIGYLAPDDFLAELREELGMPSPTSMAVWFWQKGPAKRVLWVANIWCDPMRIPIASIGDAGKKLRVISAKPIVFGAEAPKARRLAPGR